ncbi:MAG: 30S ribosomal protein S3ae [Candidatus Diapherotrites archaeon CG08_land_8_20_14_0_20_34_12]|nr:MAG: 30S ribosomal protein S3ae [Candidatus Diapherotrites archaeon CG08_land_8_20_14_0_20_34_12]
MAKMQAVVDKWKRKIWFTILAPKSFDLREIGETPAVKDVNLINRVILINLGMITGQKNFKHIIMLFKVNSVKGTNAYTDIEGHKINPGYIHRLVSRRKSKISDTLTVETADNKKVKVSALTLTGVKVERNKETRIRKLMKEAIIEKAKHCAYDNFVQEMVFGNLASDIFKKVKDLAPIKRIEITKSKILTSNKKESD